MRTLSLGQSYIALGVIIILIGLAGVGDYEDALIEEKRYCEMVRNWEVHGGERGHPNYDNRNC